MSPYPMRSISAAARAGARLAQLPQHSFSLWNKYELSKQLAFGVGMICRGSVFTSTVVGATSFRRCQHSLKPTVVAHS